MNRPLTPAQAEVLAAIRRRLDRGEPAPTYRDLCAEFGWASTGTARDHLRALERKGHVELPRDRGHRQIRLKDAPPPSVSVPLVGRVAAGLPVVAEQNLEGRIAVPAEWLGVGSHFALQVSGDSMVGAGILDGDRVVVREGAVAQDGDIVAATIEGEATLKRLRHRGSRYTLVAENPRYRAIDIRTDEATIHGVVVASMRTYSSRVRSGRQRRERGGSCTVTPDDTLWPAPPHTLAKHEILRAYLQAWFPILASWNQRIVYYDGFAGPGRYTGGEGGSPLIALSVARDHRAHLDAEIRFTFVEERPDRADHLRSELDLIEVPAHFAVEVIDGTFEDSLRRVLDDLDRIGAAIAPTFAFVDPFGIKGLPFELIARLLRRDHCEVLITFMNVSIQRFVTELPEQVNSLIGIDDAAAQIAASKDRVLRARELYMESLQSVGRFVRFFELRDRKDVPIYDLFFASNHPKGHYRMKEAMWKVDRSGAYSFSDGIDPRQAILFGPTPGRDYAPESWQRFRGATVRSEEVLEYTRDQTAFLEKHARDALKLMETEGVDGRRITVAPKKADGSARKKGTFPAGTIITFSD